MWFALIPLGVGAWVQNRLDNLTNPGKESTSIFPSLGTLVEISIIGLAAFVFYKKVIK